MNSGLTFHEINSIARKEHGVIHSTCYTFDIEIVSEKSFDLSGFKLNSKQWHQPFPPSKWIFETKQQHLTPRTCQLKDIIHIQIAILRFQIIESAIVNKKIKWTDDMLKVGEIIHNEVDLHAYCLRHRDSVLNGSGGEIDPGDVKTSLC